jgi:hypothetical protein
MRLLPMLAGLVLALPAAAEYTVTQVTNGGTIKGHITYNGKIPAPKKVNITKDPNVCGASRDDDAFVIGKGGGVKNVVVYLADIMSGKKMEGSIKPVLDQKGCRYLPHVQVVPLHTTLYVKSSDPILHNVHSFLNGSTVINFAMPPQAGLVLTKRMDKPGGEQLKCDVHSFMTGGIFVAETPYAALTDDDGAFEIKEVPPGDYSIATWHQAAGPLLQPVTVAAGGTTTFNGKIR